MRIYEPRVADGFQWVFPVDDDDFETFCSFDGSSRESTWSPVRMRLLLADDEERTLEKSDFPWLGEHVLILSSRAVDAVGGLLRNDGELLPLACDEQELWVFNPTTVVDALDQNRSELRRFDSGRIMAVSNYVFRAELVGDAVAFKVPELHRVSTFVTERFVDAVKSAGLRGVDFEMLWESCSDS